MTEDHANSDSGTSTASTPGGVEEAAARLSVGAAAAGAGPHSASRDGAASPVAKTRTIKWYVVHARDYKEYNDQLRAFGASLAEKTHGALEIDFVYSHIGAGWRDAAAERDGYARVVAGECDVSQLGVDTLGAKVISLPYIFRNYDHAEAVWRGPIGKKLLEGIATYSEHKLEALAFSYSGGFRALVGSRPVQRVEDVNGAKVMIDEGLSPDGDLLFELGAVSAFESGERPPESRHLGDTVKHVSDLLASGGIELFSVEINGLAYAEQSGPIRHAPLYISLTNHTMYATSIVANRAFLDSLDPDLRAILIEETRKFAVAERQLSALLAARNLDAFEKLPGRTVVPVSEASRRAFSEAARPVLRKDASLVAQIKEIHAAGEIPLLATSAPRAHAPA